jgi:hypothetical protein
MLPFLIDVGPVSKDFFLRAKEKINIAQLVSSRGPNIPFLDAITRDIDFPSMDV